MAKITFYGGAGAVTGANFLLDTGSLRMLIDCGTHERENICDPANHAPFAYDVHSIDALLVTHAHQDHIGRVPKLVREGFKGAIYSTPATRDLSAVMFEDAVNVMHHDAKRRNCMPIYEKADCDNALSLWHVHGYHEPFQINHRGDASMILGAGVKAGISIEFLDAGHILGSAMIKLSRGGRSVIFTGDLGNSPEPLLNDTESPEGVNYLVMESVYGDRVHEMREERAAILRKAIESARSRSGTLLIPSFSVERTQILLFEIHTMIDEGKLARIPVYLDAPLARRVTEVFRKHKGELNQRARDEFMRGDIFSFPGLVVVHGYDDSIHKVPGPKVIIAGAGMSSGGRILSHEKRYLSDPNAAFLMAGYQAPGSLGRRIQDGQKHVVIDGKKVTVRASVSSLSGYSGHRDREGLMQFVENAGQSLEKVFVTMGEPKASGFLAQRIQDFYGIEAVVPQRGQTFDIDL